MSKIGICFGGYCPMHRGHLDVIMRAKKENDECYVIVCGFDGEPRAAEIGMNLKERTAAVRRVFANDEIIKVISINDTELGIDESMSLSNWVIWQSKVKGMIPITSEDKATWYVAEPFYRDMLTKTNVIKANVVLVDKALDISGTKIRQNPLKYWNFINKEFRKNLCHNILITGTASEGKTTLVRDIARYFGIEHSEEFGRWDMLEKGKSDTDLTAEDFMDFLIGQSKDMESKIKNNKDGVFISDTDNLVTLMYAKAYADDPNIQVTHEQYDFKIDMLARMLMHRVRWNKIFLLPPKNEFVDDGTRYMKQASIDERIANFDKLVRLLKQYDLYDKVTILDRDYLGNFEIVKDYINTLF